MFSTFVANGPVRNQSIMLTLLYRTAGQHSFPASARLDNRHIDRSARRSRHFQFSNLLSCRPGNRDSDIRADSSCGLPIVGVVLFAECFASAGDPTSQRYSPGISCHRECTASPICSLRCPVWFIMLRSDAPAIAALVAWSAGSGTVWSIQAFWRSRSGARANLGLQSRGKEVRRWRANTPRNDFGAAARGAGNLGPWKPV